MKLWLAEVALLILERKKQTGKLLFRTLPVHWIAHDVWANTLEFFTGPVWVKQNHLVQKALIEITFIIFHHSRVHEQLYNFLSI